MGISPVDIEEMSLWQFSSAIEGWNANQRASELPPAMSGDEHDEMVARLGGKMGMT